MSKRPSTVQAAAALEGAEGLAAVGFGVYTGVETAIGAAVDPASAIGVTVLALAGGIGMLACARGLLRADQWSRAPTVLTQLFALPIAWSMWQSDRPGIAVPMGLVAALALITVLSPPSTAWLIDDHDEDTGVDAAEAPPKRPAPVRAAPAEPRSLGRRLMDRLKEQPTKN
ncbi:integral membrane protein [Mycobacterium tuberculosis]|nr:integral membrane protein [Mycobacterium tuberculosis]